MTEPTKENKQAGPAVANPMELVRRTETNYIAADGTFGTKCLESSWEQKDSISITKGAAGKIAWEMKFYVGSHADMLAAIGRAREIATQIEAAFAS